MVDFELSSRKVVECGGSKPVTVPSIRDARRDMYRQQIISAAEFEFARAGFDKTKITDIARTADVSMATLYKHFSGKDEIWDELNRERMDEFIAAGQHAIHDVGSPLDRLFSALRALVVHFGERPNFLRLHISEGLNWATAGTEWGRGQQRDAWRTGIGIMVTLAEEAIASGDVRSMSPSVLAGLVVSALQVWLTDWVNCGFDRSADEVASEMIDYMIRALAIQAPPTSEHQDPAPRASHLT
jgi:AcrR family transcriptional regulator